MPSLAAELGVFVWLFGKELFLSMLIIGWNKIDGAHSLIALKQSFNCPEDQLLPIQCFRLDIFKIDAALKQQT